MKLLINIMKKSVNKFFTPEDKSHGINTFFILASLTPISHISFFYEDLITNEFINDITDISNNLIQNELSKYINLYIYSKNIYNTLNKFARKWKIKKTKKYEMEFDLYLNPLTNFPNNQQISLIENDTIYKFRLTDLINIWKESLFTGEGLFPEPKKIKNPYTNLHFSKHNLYNIYFAIDNSPINIPIIIQLFFYSSFNINLFLSNNYPYLKENCIRQFITDGISFEKYEQISNMFYSYRKDISYCHLPSRSDINYSHMCSYNDKLSTALTYYLLFTYSCNPWNKDKNKKLALIRVKKFINNNPNEVIYPHLPPTRSLTGLRRRRNTLIREANSRNTTIELPRVHIPTTSPVQIPNLSPISDENIQRTRDNLDRLITDIDLAVINSNAVSPFSPSYQIPRTPDRTTTPIITGTYH
jgi:hypothetical protein